VPNLTSAAFAFLELFAFNAKQFKVSRDPGHTPFSRKVQGHVGTFPVSILAEFEVRTVSHFGVTSI